MNQLDKLNHLKNIIKQVPHERFDLDLWRTIPGTDNMTFAQLINSDANCCVIGWATADETFKRLNFMMLDGVPLYAPFRANTGEPFTYEELKTNVVYRGSEAVREFLDSIMKMSIILFLRATTLLKTQSKTRLLIISTMLLIV
ncbi:hypothetical protein PYR90_16835 (plasmid) [Acinetobacter johnsonii]|nr:hypothetical protein PYR90_16835 [Acinetobacter johnsonii]